MAKNQLTRSLRRDYTRLKLRFENAPTRLPLLGSEDDSERRMLGRLKLRKRTLLDRSAK